MARGKILALIVVVVAAGWLLWPKAPVAPVSAPVETHVKPESTSSPVPERVVLPIASEITLNVPDAPPIDDVTTLDLLITTFRKHLGSNPVGENEEITAALRGKNPKHLVYLPDTGSFLNASGELIDRWGTPYFFHSVAADRLDIRSAGPDREMWTGDDVALSP